ncbi:MAG: choice-of-anchor X domain-containing protein [Planctomycetota bacterium]
MKRDKLPPPTALPIVTEISPAPADNKPPWIELHNPTNRKMKVEDFSLVINDKFKYVLPENVPAIPPKAFILLQFDGQEQRAGDYKFKDRVLTLHLPDRLRHAMKPSAGQIAVYSKDRLGQEKLVDFVAWGAPGSQESLTPERHRIWKKQWFVPQVNTFGDYDEEMLAKAKDFSIARYPGSVGRDLSDWVVLYGKEQTPGAGNKIPGIGMFTLTDNAVVRSEDISVGWTSSEFAQKYKVQLARDASFQDMFEEVTLTKPYYKPKSVLPEGNYYYRVKVIDAQGRESAWSRTMRVNSKRMGRSQDGAIEDGAVEVLLNAMQFKYQKKDTNSLCLDGCASHLNAATVKHWDNIHPEAVPGNTDHGSMNCVRASISMMVSFYGKTLTQDRISYFTQEERAGVGNGIPEGDLAHRDGMSYHAEETAALEWALDETITDFVDTPNPSFNDLKSWLNASRPIMTRRPGHLRTMNGYMEDDDGTEWVHILDPWSGPRWETYTVWNAAARGTWVGPVSAPNALEDEASIANDTDHDGIMDFDEQIRFATGGLDTDSDNDKVWDKEDLYEYVFLGNALLYVKRDADFDADGVRKEKDPDNDGDTFNDGCEDKDGDGIYEPAAGETNNFAADTNLVCGETPIHAIVVFDRSGSMVYPPSDPIKKYDRAADAATLFMDTWLANDVPAQTKIGLVYYDHAAYFDASATSDTTLGLLTEAKRNKIAASFATNRPDYGSTSIGGGILKAMDTQGFNVSGTPIDDQDRVIVVLTDGKENADPRMDDAAVTQALVDNRVDGYVLGIGNDTQIDVSKLDALASILNHPPASLAKDLAAFELEKFFLQVLAETQGMEFSTDPVAQITVGQTKTHAVPVNPGAERVTFVVVWNEGNGKIEFTMRDSSNQLVTADVTKVHDRYQISTKGSPAPGQWTLTLTASATGTPAPGIINYSMMALEKNDSINSHFQIQGGHFLAGSHLRLTADLSQKKLAPRNGQVIVQVQHPTVGLGTFRAKTQIRIPDDLPPVEKDVILTPVAKKYQAMAAKGMKVPRRTATLTLNDQGKDGDEIPGDGKYTATFKQTRYDGIYTFRFVARAGQDRRRAMLNREKLMSVYLRPRIHRRRSSLTVLQREYRPATKQTYLKVAVTPKDSFENDLGPGQADLLKFDVKNSRVLRIVDKSDGTYEVEIMAAGDYTAKPGLLSTFRRLRAGGN